MKLDDLMFSFISFVNLEDGTTPTTTNHLHSLLLFSLTWKGNTGTVLASHSTKNTFQQSPNLEQ